MKIRELKSAAAPIAMIFAASAYLKIHSKKKIHMNLKVHSQSSDKNERMVFFYFSDSVKLPLKNLVRTNTLAVK